MSTVLFLNVFVVLSAYLARYKDFKFGLKISFLLIFIFLSLRYNFGNDYMSYYNGFLTVNSYSSINYFNKAFHYEPGWLFLCRVFKPFGFFSLVIVLAAFNCIVYYLFIKRYVPIRYYWLAVFLYVFTPDLMLVQSSAMRQSIAIGLFLISIPYIYKKDAARYFLCIGIAYLFHSSSLLLIPVYLIGIFNLKINKTIGIILLVIFLLLFIFGNLILSPVNSLLDTYFQQYEIYSRAGSEINSGFGIILMSIILIFILFYSQFQHKESDVLFKLAILGSMFIPVGLLILMFGRIGMYFTPVTIAVYPTIFKKIKEPMVKRLFSVFIILFTLYAFEMFFNSPVYKDKFKNYQTIFSAPSVAN